MNNFLYQFLAIYKEVMYYDMIGQLIRMQKRG